MFTDKQIAEIEDYLSNVSKESRIYLGCDSVRHRKYDKKTKKVEWYATYTLVVVVHIDNCHGAKIFHASTTERDYCKDKRKPSYRLMNEVAKVTTLYTDQYERLFKGREIEVHLDINDDPKHGSYCVLQQAIGYVQGVTGVRPKIKPDAWAASYSADRGRRLDNYEVKECHHV